MEWSWIQPLSRTRMQRSRRRRKREMEKEKQTEKEEKETQKEKQMEMTSHGLLLDDPSHAEATSMDQEQGQGDEGIEQQTQQRGQVREEVEEADPMSEEDKA